MEKLISAKKIKDLLKWMNEYGTLEMKRCVPFLLNEIYEMPDERKKGHWIFHSYKDEEPYDYMWAYNECSVCHKTLIEEYDYCPFCGSKMNEDFKEVAKCI